MSDLDAASRHQKMINAATWLATQGFASIGWGAQAHDKAINRKWKSDATDDPALVGQLLRGARNALVIPVGRAIIIDVDEAHAWDDLAGAGLNETFIVDSPTPGHGHVYGWVPRSVDMATIPGTFDGGEIRRHSPVTNVASMVLGPWSKRSDGIYTPRPGPRVVAELPTSVIDHIVTAARHQSAERKAATGPDEVGWKIATGRHDWLVGRARTLRGDGLSGDRLLDEIRRLDHDRCDPPLADVPGRGDAELVSIVAWTNQNIADDMPGIRLVFDTPATPPGPSTFAGIDAVDLLALALPELRMIVPDLLPEGTTALASPPKVGKSCLVYQMAVEVAIGGSVLGRRVTPGAVLYLALEDGQRRGQARLRAALGGRTLPRDRLEVRWSAPAIGEGLEELLTGWLDAHPDAAMVAIDTLQKVRQRTTGKRGQYEVDVDDLGRLQALFRDRPVALVIVHHSRKEAGHDDFLASVSGTYGITGSVDTIIVIRRKRLERFGTIVVTGREIAEAELSVQFDGMLWSGAAASLPSASFERMEVFRAIEEAGPMFPQAIADRTGLGRTSVQNMITKMVADGAVIRTSKGYQIGGLTLYTSGDSDDSDSHQSHRGYTREREPVPASVDCHDFRRHQSGHRRAGNGWTCDTCTDAQAVLA